MRKWTVEMSYWTNVTVEGISAKTEEEAIQKAKELMDKNPYEYADVDDLQFDEVNFVTED